MSMPIPSYDIDIFSREAVCNARAVDDALREFAPVVRLADGTVMVARHAHVTAGLLDWKSFSNRSRPWHDADSIRPEILLTDDPPRHTHVRAAMTKALSPALIEGMRASFERDAAAIFDEVLGREGEIIDAVADITRRFVYKALPDAFGMRVEGREHMYAFGDMVWATMGPQNELFTQAMVGVEPVLAWLDQCVNRENLEPGGIGMAIYSLADEALITPGEAKLLCQTVLAAGADTTVLTMANAMRAFALFPDEFQKLRDDPKLVRAAFDESLRWDSPSRMAGRITTQEIDIEGYRIPAGQRIGLMFAAANRDPRAWVEPDAFQVGRDLKKQVGWGYGVHACVGRLLAQLEAHVLLTEAARRVTRFESAGEMEPWMTTVGHGPAKLPLRAFGYALPGAARRRGAGARMSTEHEQPKGANE